MEQYSIDLVDALLPFFSKSVVAKASRLELISKRITNDLVTFIIRGDTNDHAVRISPREYHCSCLGFSRHKRCSHLLLGFMAIANEHPNIFKTAFRLMLTDSNFKSKRV